MGNELLGELLTYILSDPADRTFLISLKEAINSIPAEHTTQEEELLDRMLDVLLANKIEEKKQVFQIYLGMGFKDELKSYVSVIENGRVNKAYKKELIERINSINIANILNPIVEDLQDNLLSLEGGNPGKSRRQYMDTIMEHILDLQNRSYLLVVDKSKNQAMIIDPENGLGDTGEVVHKQIDKAAKSKIKTIPSIDMLVGGGFLPGSLVLICCLSGHGKSLIMQNIAIYASINNKKEDFEVREGMKPCILFVSYEMKLIQLLQRHLSFYGYSDKNLIYDTPKEELDKLILEETKKHGVELPIVYDDQITIDEDSTGNPTADDIRKSIKRYQMAGYEPVMVIVDYIGLMDVKSKQGKKLGATGADGSYALSQKARELRQVGIEYQIPIVSAQQLDSEANMIFSQVQQFSKIIDPLVLMGDNMLRGSKQVKDNLEILMYGDVFKIAKPLSKDSNSKVIEYDSYVALNVKKDRDDVSYYKASERDFETIDGYKRMSEKVKNDAQTRRFFQEPQKPLCVIPLIDKTMKMHPFDYGRSVRTYYCNNLGTAIDINALKESEEDIDLAFNSLENDEDLDNLE